MSLPLIDSFKTKFYPASTYSQCSGAFFHGRERSAARRQACSWTDSLENVGTIGFLGAPGTAPLVNTALDWTPPVWRGGVARDLDKRLPRWRLPWRWFVNALGFLYHQAWNCLTGIQ